MAVLKPFETVTMNSQKASGEKTFSLQSFLFREVQFGKVWLKQEEPCIVDSFGISLGGDGLESALRNDKQPSRADLAW